MSNETEQKVTFSVAMPHSLFDRMEDARHREPYHVSRSAYVVGLIEEGIEARENETQSNN